MALITAIPQMPLSDNSATLSFVMPPIAMTGMETVQLYVTPPKGSVERPVMELKGFEKVKLAPGEKKHVRFELDKKAFSYYDESKSAFTYEHGEYIISLGMSVEDIRQTVMINL